MAEATVQDSIEAATNHLTLRRPQILSAGAIIAQFLIVRDGLSSYVPADELNATAATLTAGIWANNED
jgi:hypothetical protein